MEPGADLKKSPKPPLISSSPTVGAVMRDKILSRVLFPAPLLPTMPTDSPCLIEKLTSLSAQKSVVRLFCNHGREQAQGIEAGRRAELIVSCRAR